LTKHTVIVEYKQLLFVHVEAFMHTTGFPSPARDFEERELDLHSLLVNSPSSTFFMKAEGENCPDLAVNPGDILVVDRSIEPKGEDIIISSNSGELVLSSYKGPSGKKGQDTHAGPVWGVVTWIIHKTR
jgi:DNA polymerase V